jgi:hypothetical protein
MAAVKQRDHIAIGHADRFEAARLFDNRPTIDRCGSSARRTHDGA